VGFAGECCDAEIGKLAKLAQNNKADMILSIGGKKSLDTAKAVGYKQNCEVIVVPTITSTDAPCSGLSVIYNKNGEFNRYLLRPHNTYVVLVDTKMITQAPARFLVAGMGDAFATWFEADDCRIKRGTNMTGRVGPMTAYAMAHLCHET
jgi:glycerol dehydrogenase